MPKVAKEMSEKKLSDISNLAKSSKSGKKKSEKNGDPTVLADLANLIRQIDVLRVRANKLKTNSSLRSDDIESFKCVLSDVHASLQPWLMRFQVPFLRQDTSSCNQSIPQLMGTLSCKENDSTSSPRRIQEFGAGTSISPSPLVSWHAECQAENGRQLFLLTPLPKAKVMSVKCQDFSASTLNYHGKVGPFTSRLSIRENCHDDRSQMVAAAKGETVRGMVEKVVGDPEKALDGISGSASMKANSSRSGVGLKSKLLSNQKRSNKTYLVTPCLKMSPPKTCLLLEQISETCGAEQNNPPEITPLTVRVLRFDETHSVEHSREDISKILASRYPTMFQLARANKTACTKKEFEASPDHLISPPKTCILLAPSPSVNRPPVFAAVGNQKAVMNIPTFEINEEDGGQGHHCEEIFHDATTNTAVPECTPWNLGKVGDTGKAPGEQTLKRELWTKFESISVHSLELNCSADTIPTKFLHRLEEASEERSPVSKTEKTNLWV